MLESPRLQPFLAVAFAPNGHVFATACKDERPPAVLLWEAKTGRQLACLKGHWTRVRCLAFSADAKWLASGDESGTIKLWDVQAAKRAER